MSMKNDVILLLYLDVSVAMYICIRMCLCMHVCVHACANMLGVGVHVHNN